MFHKIRAAKALSPGLTLTVYCPVSGTVQMPAGRDSVSSILKGQRLGLISERTKHVTARCKSKAEIIWTLSLLMPTADIASFQGNVNQDLHV